MTPVIPESTIPPSPKKRRAYRVPLGMPKSRENRRIGRIVSVLVHLGLLALLIPLSVTGDVREIPQGAGGPGPAGGGGGGSRAIEREHLQFVRVAPAPAPTLQLKVVPPPTPSATPQPRLDALKLPEPALTGTGTTFTAGSGPGSGGGVGTGVGTGRGSAVGGGTGGGEQANYPPTAIEMLLPPIPVPASVRGTSVVVEFDIDDTGRVLSVKGETRDRGYTRMLMDKLRGYRFRPGTTPAGTPIRMKYQIIIDL